MSGYHAGTTFILDYPDTCSPMLSLDVWRAWHILLNVLQQPSILTQEFVVMTMEPNDL